jgi:biotin operon repressor
MDGQETSEQKLTEGLAYIERLKADGENVSSVENDGKQLTILIEE